VLQGSEVVENGKINRHGLSFPDREQAILGSDGTLDYWFE
jgi:hypothetical protein